MVEKCVIEYFFLDNGYGNVHEQQTLDSLTGNCHERDERYWFYNDKDIINGTLMAESSQ